VEAVVEIPKRRGIQQTAPTVVAPAPQKKNQRSMLDNLPDWAVSHMAVNKEKLTEILNSYKQLGRHNNLLVEKYYTCIAHEGCSHMLRVNPTTSEMYTVEESGEHAAARDLKVFDAFFEEKILNDIDEAQCQSALIQSASFAVNKLSGLPNMYLNCFITSGLVVSAFHLIQLV
jgi:hypothetical protein